MGQRRLRLTRRIKRTGRHRKNDEEGVARGIYFDPALAGEDLSYDPSVFGEGLRVRLGPHLVEKLRRALDISEEEHLV